MPAMFIRSNVGNLDLIFVALQVPGLMEEMVLISRLTLQPVTGALGNQLPETGTS
jgi:hypothetical protein